MSDLDKALQTQLDNIQAKTGQSLQQLFKVIEDSGRIKHGEIVKFLKADLKLGHGDANTLTHVFRKRGETEKPLAALIDDIYAEKKAHLRPIHDKFMQAVDAFGEFEIAPKKGYLSLRRKRQFAMIGPATNSRVDIGINAKDLESGERLIENEPGGMSQYTVRLTEASQVDEQLLAWVKQAYAAAG